MIEGIRWARAGKLHLCLFVVVCATACATQTTRQTPLSAQEQARRARLPRDGRPFDAHWGSVEVEVRQAGDRTIASVDLRGAKLRLFLHDKGEDRATAMPDIQAMLRQLIPIDVDSVEVFGGQLLVVEMDRKGKPELWIHDLELSIENLTSRQHLMEGRPMLLVGRGKLQSSGSIALFATADPWGESLNFAGTASITGLRTADLYGVLKSRADIQAPAGTLDLYIAFRADRGKIAGGVKTVFRRLEVRPATKQSLWSRSKARVVDALAGLFSHGPRDTITTIVPVEGPITDPSEQVWPALTNLLYDAFVQGISAGFGGLPPRQRPSDVAMPSDQERGGKG